MFADVKLKYESIKKAALEALEAEATAKATPPVEGPPKATPKRPTMPGGRKTPPVVAAPPNIPLSNVTPEPQTAVQKEAVETIEIIKDALGEKKPPALQPNVSLNTPGTSLNGTEDTYNKVLKQFIINAIGKMQ